MAQDDTAPPSHDELHPDLGEASHDLHMQVRFAVRTLQRSGWCYREIGMCMGYREGRGAKQRASDIINEQWTPPAERCKLLSKAASARGFDGIPDDFTGPGKRAVPAPTREAFQGDQRIDQELRAARDCLGAASQSDRRSIKRRGCLTSLRESLRHFRAARAQIWCAELEIEGRLAMLDGSGDGLPSQPSLAL